jgi:DNA repair protein SbcD/Mre11
MSQRPFRFLHTADLHLDAAMEGLAETPAGLNELLIECPLRAAAKVFDAAIDQQVDFVVLAGGILDPNRSGHREWLFLIEQFQRMADRSIHVYWSLSYDERVELWPQYIALPANVRLFPAGRIERVRHEHNGSLLAEIIGASHTASGPPRAYEFAATESSVFSIAVVHADWGAAALGEIGIDYWALGGPHQRATPSELNGVVHFSGSPQGRRSDEAGPHGCTIVSVDERGTVRLNPIACDVVRWISPRISFPDSAGESELEFALFQRARQLADESGGVAMLVDWKIDCGEALRRALRHGLLARTLELKLRDEFGRRPPPVWTVRIEAEAPEVMPKNWHEEETIRGDFLRLVETYRIHSPPVAELPALVGQHDLPVEFSESADSLRRLLPEVAWLGASLLSPEEAAR